MSIDAASLKMISFCCFWSVPRPPLESLLSRMSNTSYQIVIEILEPFGMKIDRLIR